ncbi:hypothetical protein E2R33_09805 [Rathayibacter toxicus]|uniref:hypothetical protein n=1 Tax=Rathayibacter toxicus TaxID=145458 RepID=UPI001C03EABA|nr:hypothetical protein [Rathayibacter toxicus]QWL28865.1 hypothetical protein E2R33_09805 [Rathayibacter toxicus]
MPANTVYFIDTSVLLNMLRIPGKCQDASKIHAEFRTLKSAGAKFVLPITALIETGNAIAQCKSDRRRAAEKYVDAITAARDNSAPWIIRDVHWDTDFIDTLVRGASTGQFLVDHLSASSLGGGDLAILVERDRFLAETAFTDVRVWTLDTRLDAHA